MFRIWVHTHLTEPEPRGVVQRSGAVFAAPWAVHIGSPFQEGIHDLQQENVQ